MEKDKVVEIFREIVGKKAENLSGSFYPAYANTKKQIIVTSLRV
jgi:hypothetical protein